MIPLDEGLYPAVIIEYLPATLMAVHERSSEISGKYSRSLLNGNTYNVR